MNEEIEKLARDYYCADQMFMQFALDITNAQSANEKHGCFICLQNASEKRNMTANVLAEAIVKELAIK